MAKSTDLSFNVAALDNASKTFIKLSQQVERMSDKLEELDGKRASPEINVNVDKSSKVIARFESSMASALGTLRSLGRAGPAALAGLVGTAVLASGAIAALASAAAVTAGGIAASIAGIALGAKLFAQTERGQAALARFKVNAQSILVGAADPLLDSFEDALPQVAALLADLRPAMRSVFDFLGHVVSRGVDRSVAALGRLGPALGRVTEAGAGFLAGLTSTFGEISRRLTPALRELAPTLQVVATLLGAQLGDSLSRLLPQIVRLARRALPLLPAVLKLVTGALGALINVGNIFLDQLGAVLVTLSQVRVAFAKWRVSINLALNALPGINREMQVAQSLLGLVAAQAGLAGMRTQFFGNQSGALSGALATQTSRTKRARLALVNYRDTILTAIQGQIDYKRQVDLTSKELRQGAASFNLNTKAGRENAQAVLDQIQAARTQIKTYREQGRTTAFVTRKTSQFSRELAREAREAGFTNKQIINLIANSNNIPKSVRQRIRSNADSVADAVAALIAQSHEFEGVYTARYRTIHENIGTPAGTVLGGLTKRAVGGPVTRARPYIVGEEGPELFVPRHSGRIVPNDRLASGSGYGATAPFRDLIVQTTPQATAGEIINEALHQTRVVRAGGR